MSEQHILVGYKQSEVGLIPNDWKIEKLDKLTSLIIDGTHHTPTYTTYGIPFLRVTDIQGELNHSEFKFVSDVEHAQLIRRCKPEKGDLLLSKNGTIGIPRVVSWDWEFSIFVSLALIKLNKKLLDVSYLNQFFKSNFLDLQLSQRAKQGTVTNLHLEEIRELLIPLPPTKVEQISIANALSDVDALINGLEKLITKKQAIKTATMQQLLTGRTRLPRFTLREDGSQKGYKPSELGEIPEDWSVAPLKLLLKDPPRYGINAPAVPLDGKLPVYIRITDISEKGYFSPTEKVGVKSPFSHLYILNEGDIVLARTGASVGKSYLYRKEDGVLIYAGFLIKVSPDSEKLDSKYLSQYLKTEQYWAWVNVNSMRSGQPGINGNEYGSLLIPCPSNLKEQTAIATILSDMDEELQALEQRLSKTRQIKQGMMQELLTGKTRLVKPEDDYHVSA